LKIIEFIDKERNEKRDLRCMKSSVKWLWDGDNRRRGFAPKPVLLYLKHWNRIAF